MSRNYQNSDEFRRMDQQFCETMDERNARQRERRFRTSIETLQKLIVDLSPYLADECDYPSDVWIAELRRRTANAIPVDLCPDWLRDYRDAPIVQS